MSGASNNNQDKIDFAKFIIEHNTELINFADTKAGFILATAGVIMGLLFLMNRDGMNDFTKCTLFATAISLGISAFFAFNVIRARLTKNPPETSMYFQSIKKLSRDTYITKFKNLDSELILSDYLNNIHSISIIENKKFSNLNISLYFMIPSLILLIITIASYFFFTTPHVTNLIPLQQS